LKMLEENKTLEELDLRTNKIEINDILELTEILKKRSSLENFKISFNKFGKFQFADIKFNFVGENEKNIKL